MNKRLIPYLFLAAGAAMRIAGLTVSSFWYDEAFSIFLSRFPAKMIYLEFTDFNPPLWQLVVSPFLWWLGENEFALRLPALLFSLAAMLITWKLAEELLPDHARIPAAALIGLLPYQFWLAQDGRCYAMLSMFYVLALWMVLKGRWLGFGACVGLLVYSHITGAFYAAAAGLGALFIRWPERKKIIIWGAAGAAAFLPWVPALLDQPAQHWLGKLTFDGLITSLYQISYAGVFPLNVARLAGLVFIGYIFAALFWSRHKYTQLLGIWAVGPLALLLIAALYKNLIFYRPLSAMLLPVCLWLPAALWPEKPRYFHWGLSGLWGVLLLAGLVAWSPGLKGGELRQVAQSINHQWKNGDIVYHATGTSYLPFALYLSEPGYILDESLPAGLLQTYIQEQFKIPRAALENIPHQRAWVIYARDVLITPQANARMMKYIEGGHLVGTVHYWQAAIIEIYLVESIPTE